METKSLLDCPTCCCLLASFEHVCVESHGAVQADGMILSQVIVYFCFVFSYRLRELQEVYFTSNMFWF